MTEEWEKEFREKLDERYRLIRRIGKGGTAFVFEAADTRHDRHVAIKVLRPDVAEFFATQRFRREIRLVARLTHPNILTLLDSGEAAGLPFYVMPYVTGDTLLQRMSREKRLPINEAVTLICEVADALDYAHAAGVIHRDIKPANILLIGRHGVVTDFGAGRATRLASGESMETQQGIIIGTPEYMSPEQVVPGADVDARSDQYSLALVLYEMLAGTLPFAGANSRAMMAQRLIMDPAPLVTVRSDVPHEIEEALMRALSREPDERFPSTGDFARAISGAHGESQDGRSIRGSTTPADGVISGPTFAAAATSQPSRSVRAAIAVIPFEAVGDSADGDYLADGLTEEITSTLGRLRALQVVARTSASRFKGTATDVRSIGEQLGVQAVLEGSVVRAGSRIRVHARLISTADGCQLFADEFVRDASDVFAVQEEIARALAEAMEVRLLGQVPGALLVTPTGSAAAHDLYLRGRFAWNKRTEEQLQRAVDYFQRAIALDNDYAAAHAALADAYMALCVYGVRAPMEVVPSAHRAVQRALEIDPTAADAHTGLGSILSIYEWDWDAAEGEFQRAIVLDPNYSVARHQYAVNVLAPLGRFDEALAQLQQAMALEPLSGVVSASVGVVLSAARRFGDSAMQHERTIQLEPNFGLAHFFLGQALVQMSAFSRAIASFQRAIDLSGRSPEIVSALAHAVARSGDATRARELLAELEQMAARRYVSPYLLAQVHVGLGDNHDALAWLERACDGRAAELSWLGVRALWDPLRDEERFQEVARRVGVRVI